MTPAGLQHGGMTPSGMTPAGLGHGGMTPVGLTHGGMTPAGLQHGGMTPSGNCYILIDAGKRRQASLNIIRHFEKGKMSTEIPRCVNLLSSSRVSGYLYLKKWSITLYKDLKTL